MDKTQVTCEGVYIFVSTSANVDACSILFDEFYNLVNIRQRQVVALQELLSRVVGVFCIAYPQRDFDRAKGKVITCNIIGKFERGCAILDIDIEHIVVFFPLVKLFAPRANGIDNVSNFLPGRINAIPLENP